MTATISLHDDRRSAVRVNVRLRTEVSAALGASDAVVCATHDVSSHGICLPFNERLCMVLSGPLERGTLLNINLYLEHDPMPVHCTGKVVWSESRGASGLDIVELDQNDQKRIDALVREQIERRHSKLMV